MVQARGYPDDLTCSFLRFIYEENQEIPILVLVDCDPDGLNIFRCYRYGSSRHGSISNLGARWLGIKTGQTLDMFTTNHGIPTPMENFASDDGASFVPPDSNDGGLASRISLSSIACREPVDHLSLRDRKMAAFTLQKLEDESTDDEQMDELKREMKIMMMLGVKTEIQWLDESGSLVDWLDNQLLGSVGP